MIGPPADITTVVTETSRDDLSSGMSSDHRKATSHSVRQRPADQTRIGLVRTGSLHRECTHNSRLWSESLQD